MRIRSAGEIMNYFDFYSMQADSLHACVPIPVLNSFSTKMLVRQVGHVTTDMSYVSTLLQLMYEHNINVAGFSPSKKQNSP